MKKKLLAEFLGTYALVFAGTGAIIINQEANGVITHVGIAITFGLIVMCMIYAFGNVSGAHFNPAVSIAFSIAKKLEAKKLAPYIISQLSGAIAASASLKLLFPHNQLLGATLPAGSDIQSFILELILSFFLMLVILSVSQGSKEQGMFAGIAIGSIVGLEALFAGPICGASMNPARSIAPAIVGWHLTHLWLYVIAPIAGMAGAVIVYKLLKE